jgi:hypothetical protein
MFHPALAVRRHGEGWGGVNPMKELKNEARARGGVRGDVPQMQRCGRSFPWGVHYPLPRLTPERLKFFALICDALL